MTTDATPAKVRLTEVLAVTTPVVVSYGAGTNSTAMVCEMVRRGEPIYSDGPLPERGWD